MKLHILGTGNGGAIKCYNTCFALENNNEYFLVDGGGGNQILLQLEKAGIALNKIHNIFLSHNHTDHILGVIWVLRSICANMRFAGKYEGNLNIYGSDESMSVLKHLIDLLFPPARAFIDKRVFFNVVEDGQVENIIGKEFTFFDIHAKKDKQFGFIQNSNLAFCGDEPLKEEIFEIAKGKKWLLHESFCLDSEETIFNAHLKGHCTVKEAGQIAESLGVENLIIVHTEDNDLKNRRALYTKEAASEFGGNIFIPNDLDVLNI